MNSLKVSKLERFVQEHPEMSFDQVASQLNRTPGQIERAYDRLRKKEQAAAKVFAEMAKLMESK